MTLRIYTECSDAEFPTGHQNSPLASTIECYGPRVSTSKLFMKALTLPTYQ